MDRDGVDIGLKSSTMLGLSYYLLVVMLVNAAYFSLRMYIEIKRRFWEPFIQTECFKVNFPEAAE